MTVAEVVKELLKLPQDVPATVLVGTYCDEDVECGPIIFFDGAAVLISGSIWEASHGRAESDS